MDPNGFFSCRASDPEEVPTCGVLLDLGHLGSSFLKASSYNILLMFFFGNLQ